MAAADSAVVQAGACSGPVNPDPLRLFTGSMSNEVSWLLPFGLFSGLLLTLRSRLKWPVSEKHQAVLLWGGWLVTGGVFFSIAGFFHPYYLTTLAPPLAALTGLGVAELWNMRHKRWWLALPLSAVAVGGTVWVQYRTALTFVGIIWWLPLVAGLLSAGIMLSTMARSQWQWMARIGFGCLVAALLITPGIWSGLTTLYSRDSLPSAYSGQAGGQRGFGFGGGSLQVDQTLLAFRAGEHAGHEVPDGRAQLEPGGRVRDCHNAPGIVPGRIRWAGSGGDG